ncbi:MAG: hypothetical protein HY053_05585 [Proteobacteria bacterium]|nr:hypothetical protein [Pseudomonadota bacterium]
MKIPTRRTVELALVLAVAYPALTQLPSSGTPACITPQLHADDGRDVGSFMDPAGGWHYGEPRSAREFVENNIKLYEDWMNGRSKQRVFKLTFMHIDQHGKQTVFEYGPTPRIYKGPYAEEKDFGMRYPSDAAKAATKHQLLQFLEARGELYAKGEPVPDDKRNCSATSRNNLELG